MQFKFPAHLTAAAGLLLFAGSALAQSTASPVILQWFEARWDTIERRMPDYFIAGYGATWLPPASKASSGSPGYDPFNLFDLGSPSSETLYGTEQSFQSMVTEFHRASGLVYLDTIMNHTQGRTTNAQFVADGGWPGFYLPNPPLDWGDFHDGSTQSQDPGGANYNLYNGDLVGLCDIAHESNISFIRHPVAVGNPQNIPAGAVRNLPNASNYRFYPDQGLTPLVFNNPGFMDSRCQGSFVGCPNDPNPPFGNRNTSAFQVTVYPFNNAAPLSGDPIAENATGMLTRWCQWMLEVNKIDGFRLDAAKHIPFWFWDRFWDNRVYLRRTAPDGTAVTPFSFCESVASNDYVFDFNIRKTNGRNPARTGDSFGNRDALDLAGAGQARDLINARGFGNWNSVTSAHLDNIDDGFNNGTLGVMHVYSHDNGSAGDGGSAPALPAADKAGWPQFCYLLMRPGTTKIYHNARSFANLGSRGFWPREGSPEALGLGRALSGTDPTLTRLVQLHNRYARGEYTPRFQTSDVLVFERRTPIGGGSYVGNCLVGVNDRYDAGFDEVVVDTSFPTGTRLWELTGNANDAVVDPSGQISDLLIVGSASPAVGPNQVRIRVPRNRANTTDHNKGFVVYGPATPSGALAVSSGLHSTIAADSGAVPAYNRRLSAIDVVKSSSFTIELDTTQTDAGESRTDDKAVYRFNQGFYNSDVGTNGTAASEPTGEFRGYENFLTLNQPLFTTGIGLYRQTIDTSTLPEGYNYLSVIAFRARSSGTEAGADPIYNEWRKAIYIDRVGPTMQIVASNINCTAGSGTLQLRNPDRTATKVHAFVDLGVNDPIPPLNAGNQAFSYDRQDWLWFISGLSQGTHSLTIVALEQPDGVNTLNQSTTRINFNIGPATSGDIDENGVVNIFDLYAFDSGQGSTCATDVDQDGDTDNNDRRALKNLIRTGEPTDVQASR